jgi:N-acyl-D-aspartate/D-glutamate deacylase
MHDIVIRGGAIVDGTGQNAFTGDVAVEGGRIAAIGGKAGPGRREINADGLLVTPGWVAPCGLLPICRASRADLR